MIDFLKGVWLALKGVLLWFKGLSVVAWVLQNLASVGIILAGGGLAAYLVYAKVHNHFWDKFSSALTAADEKRITRLEGESAKVKKKDAKVIKEATKKRPGETERERRDRIYDGYKDLGTKRSPKWKFWKR